MEFRVWVVLLEGLADGSVGLTFDVLRALKRLQDSGRVRGRDRLIPIPVSRNGRSVRSASGNRMRGERAFPSAHELGESDVIVVPALGWAHTEEVERGLRRSDVGAVRTLLQAAAKKRCILAASCSGTFVLADSGALDGYTATSTWWLASTFRARYPAVRLDATRMVVVQERRMTAGAAFAHSDLMLALVSKLVGASAASELTRFVVLDERPTQSRYMVAEELSRDGPLLKRLETFVLKNVERHVSAGELARTVGMSQRTLARQLARLHGTTPLRLSQRLRAERARQLLETTSLTFDQITTRVGYTEPAALRRILIRKTGQSARGFRRP